MHQDEHINYQITGSDYQAELFYSNGTSAYVLNNNVLARLGLPAGTYYWAVSSPSNSYSPSLSYEFASYKDIDNMTFNFQSDEQSGYSQRVNWGSGTYFPFKHNATVSGYAYDTEGNPAKRAPVRFTIKGSVGTSETEGGFTSVW